MKNPMLVAETLIVILEMDVTHKSTIQAETHSTINQLAPDYWIQMGRMVDGVDCVAPMIGCGVVVTNNDTSILGYFLEIGP